MFKKTLLFIIFSLLFIGLFAQYENLINSLKQKYQSVNTLEAEIVQLNFFEQQDITLESNGKFYMQGTNLVLEYMSPTYQFMKSEKNKLTVYSRNENIAFISDDNNQITSSVLHFSSLLNQDLSFDSRNNSLYIFNILKPVESIKDLKIYVEENSVAISKIEYKDEDDNKITLEIRNQKINHELSKKIEDFKIPTNATIIEN
jgi:outer membrane lipoprotein-sorting protein